MTEFSWDERQSLAALLELALREDLGKAGDITSQACIPADAFGKAALVMRQPGVLAGQQVCSRILQRVDPSVRIRELHPDGALLQPGWWIATLDGLMHSILKVERILLNFLQHLSGIASLTRQFVDAIAGTRAKIYDTRKTLPGWRLLDKYAVRAGGGCNHRLGLHDAILIKDNHLAAIRKAGAPDPVVEAIRRCRELQPGRTIEVEVDTLEQLRSALAGEPEIILLDNMNRETMAEAVALRDREAPGVLLEASGGVHLTTVRGIAETGVDRISIGAITHSAPALDIALDYLD